MTTQNKKNQKPEKTTSPPQIVDEYQIQPTLDEMALYHQYSHSTRINMQSTLQSYCKYHKTTLPDLINEALIDEDHIIKVNRRRIKKRLQNYTLHLQSIGRHPQTIKLHITRLKTIYKYYDIEPPQLPPIRVENKEHYEDIPTYEEIQHVTRNSLVKTRAIVCFLASSGMRISDMCNLTVGDFIEASIDYVWNPRSIPDFLHQLQKSGDLIIPTWHIRQQKTGIPYITFCSDEASRYLVEYLLELSRRKMITRDDRLFGVTTNAVIKTFQRLNKRFDLGKLETRGRFHAHALRKFFATTLTNHDCDFLSVEFMLGHRLDRIREAYYKADPERLKMKYRRYMEYLTFTQEIQVRDVTSTELDELEELRQYRRDTDEKLVRLEQMLDLLSTK
jgi:integrase